MERCTWAKNLRDAPPQIYKIEDRQDLLKFYLSQWPQFAGDPNHIRLWSDQLDLATDHIVKYIEAVEHWKKQKIGNPKCCLPKKKQRELGLLPSVENEIAIREGRL